jgi:predicted unusual protein kinase regulating ubiquinone biosynthesis (AarF/ABC1/UbiB family)
VRERANGEAQLVFLDAGIITELSDKDSDNFLALFDGIAYGNGEVHCHYFDELLHLGRCARYR